MLNYNGERTLWVADETELYPPIQKEKEITITTSCEAVGDLSFHDNVLCMAVQEEPNTLEVFDASSGDTFWTFKLPGSRGSMSFTCVQNDSLIVAGGQDLIEIMITNLTLD
jgi:hypothetical protein